MIKQIIKIHIFVFLITLLVFPSFSEEAISTLGNIINIKNPYYTFWKNDFIIYVDNYLGDINNVSKKDLSGDKGSSNLFIFSKLTDEDYTIDTLLNDMNNSDVSTNLHDKKPILVHLPKSAKNNESHALLKSDEEKGKLLSGGPYSKYAKYANGFYYKNKLLSNEELNKLLLEYKNEAKKITNRLNQIESFSIKDLYKNVHVTYLTNGATSVAGTPDAKIYLLDVDKKINPYNLSIRNVITDNKITGEATKDFLPDWQIETLYIYNSENKLIDKITFETFRNYLWLKQDKSIIEWLTNLNN